MSIYSEIYGSKYFHYDGGEISFVLFEKSTITAETYYRKYLEKGDHKHATIIRAGLKSNRHLITKSKKVYGEDKVNWCIEPLGSPVGYITTGREILLYSLWLDKILLKGTQLGIQRSIANRLSSRWYGADTFRSAGVGSGYTHFDVPEDQFPGLYTSWFAQHTVWNGYKDKSPFHKRYAPKCPRNLGDYEDPRGIPRDTLITDVFKAGFSWLPSGIGACAIILASKIDPEGRIENDGAFSAEMTFGKNFPGNLRGISIKMYSYRPKIQEISYFVTTDSNQLKTFVKNSDDWEEVGSGGVCYRSDAKIPDTDTRSYLYFVDMGNDEVEVVSEGINRPWLFQKGIKEVWLPWNGEKADTQLTTARCACSNSLGSRNLIYGVGTDIAMLQSTDDIRDVLSKVEISETDPDKAKKQALKEREYMWATYFWISPARSPDHYDLVLAEIEKDPSETLFIPNENGPSTHLSFSEFLPYFEQDTVRSDFTICHDKVFFSTAEVIKSILAGNQLVNDNWFVFRPSSCVNVSNTFRYGGWSIWKRMNLFQLGFYEDQSANLVNVQLINDMIKRAYNLDMSVAKLYDDLNDSPNSLLELGLPVRSNYLNTLVDCEGFINYFDGKRIKALVKANLVFDVVSREFHMRDIV